MKISRFDILIFVMGVAAIDMTIQLLIADYYGYKDFDPIYLWYSIGGWPEVIQHFVSPWVILYALLLGAREIILHNCKQKKRNRRRPMKDTAHRAVD